MKKILVAVGLVFSAAAVAADPSPVGKPEGMGKGQSVRYYVWADGDGWHVRSTTAGQKGVRKFEGTVRVTGGAVKSVEATNAQESGAKVKDFWELKDNGRELSFTLNTFSGMDGLDFALGSGVETVEFDLKIDGRTMANRVFVGKDATPIQAATFTFKLADLNIPTTKTK